MLKYALCIEDATRECDDSGTIPCISGETKVLSRIRYMPVALSSKEIKFSLDSPSDKIPGFIIDIGSCKEHVAETMSCKHFSSAVPFSQVVKRKEKAGHRTCTFFTTLN